MIAPEKEMRTIRYWLHCDYEDVRAAMRKILAGDGDEEHRAEFMVALQKIPGPERMRLFDEAKRA